ncbi:MAG: hypothetical protein IT222_03560, partial [Crocinitomix sp.]|nr:hypothetical protein [Crocinitomix sp.]
GAVQKIFTYIYLFFAQILWPIWVPIAILMFEKDATRSIFQKILAGIGVFVGIILAYFLLTYQVEASIVGYHISYTLAYPESLKYYEVVLYALATIGPPFFSHIKRMWLLGATILVSYVVTMIFYDHYILSVWCFFSSIISLSIYAIVLKSRVKKI